MVAIIALAAEKIPTTSATSAAAAATAQVPHHRITYAAAVTGRHSRSISESLWS